MLTMYERLYKGIAELHAEAMNDWNLAMSKSNRFRYFDASNVLINVAKIDAFTELIEAHFRLENNEKLLIDSAHAFAKDARGVLEEVMGGN